MVVPCYTHAPAVFLLCYCRDDRRRTNPRPYNTAFRVVVSGLPPTASWQDLKDHMRKGGEVTFAQVRNTSNAKYTFIFMFIYIQLHIDILID